MLRWLDMNIRLALAAALVLLLGTPCFALPAFQPLGDLKHTGWTIESGAPSGIQALAQSSDGYLLARRIARSLSL